VGEAEDSWCVPCGVIIMVVPCDRIGGTKDHNRERLLHVHWRVFIAYIDNAVGIGNRSIEAAVTESCIP
jgi:hypothetical protein